MKRNFLIICLLFSCISVSIYGQNTMSSPVNIGSKSDSFTYSNLLNTSSYSNAYVGRPTRDVFYKFTLTTKMDITISHNGSVISDTYVHLLNSSGTRIAYNDNNNGEPGAPYSPYHSYLKVPNLEAGTYYVVSEGNGENGYINTTIKGNLPPFVISAGTKSEYFTFSHTQNTTKTNNSYLGQTTNDIRYELILTRSMDITISHDSSEVLDTYVYLLNSSGVSMTYNNDNNGEHGAPPNRLHSYMRIPNLLAGTYYVLSEGYSQNGNIKTTIEGNIPRTEISAGIHSSDFTYTHTQNTYNTMNGYTGQATRDVFYKLTLNKAMNITISHNGSAVGDTYVHLLNSSGTRIAYNNDNNGEPGAPPSRLHSYLKVVNLAAGTYYIVSEGNSENGNITTSITGTPPPLPPFEVNAGTRSTSFTFTDTQNTAKTNNSYQGQTTNDVYYKLILNEAMDITVSHSGSALTDTYIHLLNLEGVSISSANGNSAGGGSSAFLQYWALQAGTYYIVSEGSSQDGNIKTTIDGVLVLLAEPSAHKNYVHSRTYTSETGKYLSTIVYYDGLGRPVETVQQGITQNKKDLVILQEYDAVGRKNKMWLPAVAAADNVGKYIAPNTVMTASASSSSNNDSKPYSLTEYEASPLNRVIKQFGPGEDWQTGNTSTEKAVKTAYLTNDTSVAKLDCIKYKVGGTGTELSVTRIGVYGTGQLYITGTTSEDGLEVLEFTDKQGQLLLSRQVFSTSVFYDTYYLYDDASNLKMVLTPTASNVLKDRALNDPMLQSHGTLYHLTYQYVYDHRNRCIAKKLAGAAWILYVYDKADRVILSQDGNQRNKKNASDKEWTITIPDKFGRPVITGTFKNSSSRTTLANALKDIVVTAEQTTGANNYKGYKINNYSFTNATILNVNYYDSYDFFKNIYAFPTISDTLKLQYDAPSSGGLSSRYNNTKGLLTGTWNITMGETTSTALYSVFYYDDLGRIIQTNSTNHLGGVDKGYLSYNFTGQPTQRKHIHSATGQTTQTEIYTYAYDHALRLTTAKHKLNALAEVTLAQNTYDELGRLNKTIQNNNALLTTTYGYNVRSWTKTISSQLFTQTLYYNESYQGNTKRHGGDITAMEWKINVKDDNKVRRYLYSYDKVSRLTKAVYTEPNNASANYSTAYVYATNGRMTKLTRHGRIGTSSYGVMDDLTLELLGNRLTKVSDVIRGNKEINFSLSADFKDRDTTSSTEYTYDYNGNMNKDLNKGIDSITYNSLNLPITLLAKLGSTTYINNYVYSLFGTKLSVVHKKNNTITKKVDHIGNMIYEDDALKRILIDGGYIERELVGSTYVYNYYFYLTDHLGNVRVVAKKDVTSATVTNGTGIVQSNHYYPFGMAFAEGVATSQQPYKYNGKELDKEDDLLNWYDYDARHYDPVLGRFTTIDPLAEKYYSISPYAYVANNPMRFIDPTGMAYRPTMDADGNYSGFEWVDDSEAYDENGALKDGLFEKAILFQDNGTWKLGAYKNGSYTSFNIGSATATVYDYTETVSEDGSITRSPSSSTFDASTKPSDPSMFGTIARNQLLQAVRHMHKGTYMALQMRTLAGSAYLPAEGGINPRNGSGYVGGGNVHMPGASNQTGTKLTTTTAYEYFYYNEMASSLYQINVTSTSKYSGVSEGCFLIDATRWVEFMNHFPAGVGSIGVINK